MIISHAAGPGVEGALTTAAPIAVTRWSRRVAADLVGFLDIAAIVAGAVLPAFIYMKAGGLVANWLHVIQSGLVTALIAYGCLRNWHMYDTSAMHDFPVRAGTLLAALGVAFIAVLGLGVPFKVTTVHLWVWYGVWASASFTLLLASRAVARTILARLTEAGRFDTRVAVFGAGTIARRVHDHLVNPALGIKFAGVYDDRVGEARLNPEGLAVRGRLEDLIAAGLRGEFDQVIVALPQSADSRAVDIAKKLEQLPVSLHVVTHIEGDLIEAAQSHSVSSLGPVGLLDVKKRPLSDWAPLVKQAEDCILTSVAMIVALPLMALIALAIRLDSRGPVLFSQRRRGLNQNVIEVLKFRTMTVIEDGQDIRQVTANDPRVTRVGRLLRRFSFDELPQLVNVLKGEMSLVGPRPHALVHDEQWGEMLEGYANRHQVKPGLTGLAQVAGLRGHASSTDKIRHRVEHDLTYIRTWSLGGDLKILVRTIWIVIRGDNAH